MNQNQSKKAIPIPENEVNDTNHKVLEILANHEVYNHGRIIVERMDCNHSHLLHVTKKLTRLSKIPNDNPLNQYIELIQVIDHVFITSKPDMNHVIYCDYKIHRIFIVLKVTRKQYEPQYIRDNLD